MENFISSIYGKKEATPFQDVLSLCKIEETRLKATIDIGSNEENQAYAAMSRRRRFGKFGPQKKRRNMDKIRCYGCNELGHNRKLMLPKKWKN